MKVIELTIDDFEGFIDAIALVNRPAHESNFFWFASEEKPKEIYELLDEEQMSQLASALGELGDSWDKMKEDGYFLYKIEDVFQPELFYSSDPNPAGENEYLPRVRYAYTHPMPAGRVFCKGMMRANRLYTEQDLLPLSDLNPVGPAGYSVLTWRGSYNCRGKWKKLTFLPKVESGDLVNKNTTTKGLVESETGVLYDTRTTSTIAAAARGTRADGTPSKQYKPGEARVGGFSQNFSLISVIDDIPVFERKEDAEIFAEIIGCSGSFQYQLEDGTIGYMPCEEMKKEQMADCSCKDGYESDGFSCVPVDNSKMLFAENDEKMEITGAAMIPNKLIIRRTEPTMNNPQGEFYYVFFTEETIKKLAEKFMESKLLDSTNIEHNDNIKADTYVKESWIVEDPEKDKSAALGLSYPKGTWVITSKVKNPEIWKKIKQGILNGYSVQGWFAENLLFR